MWNSTNGEHIVTMAAALAAGDEVCEITTKGHAMMSVYQAVAAQDCVHVAV